MALEALLPTVSLGPHLVKSLDIFLHLQHEKLTVTLKDQNGAELMFKMRPSTLIGKLKEAYLSQRIVEVSHIPRSLEQYYLLFEGTRLCPAATVEMSGIEDGDIIDVIVMQHGD